MDARRTYGHGRRQFLKLMIGAVSAAGGSVGLLAACAPTPPAPPPPTAVPKPGAAATAPPTPAATAAPQVQVQVQPTAPSKPAATQVPQGIAANGSAAPNGAAAGAPRMGQNLIGKLEGPEIVLDPAQFPKSFNEPPELAELVKAGRLPPVAERIGQDPLVVRPVHGVGKYGGTLRRAFIGPVDRQNGNRLTTGPDNLLYFDYQWKKVIPNLARGFELSDDARVTTLFLRRGMCWSDGAPFTAEDILFWYQDLYGHKELVPNPHANMMINGKPGVVEQVDTHTVRYRFPDPNPLFPELLAGWTGLGGLSLEGLNAMGGYAPKHYLKQFHPAYTPREELDQRVRDAKFDNWVALFKNRNSWHFNADLPSLSPWKTAQPINTPAWLLERNPYSIWVDTDGNQLPYLEKVSMTLAENAEIINLRVMAGEYDFQARHIDLQKLPVLLQNADRGGYKVYMDPGENGGDYCLRINLAYEADAEIGEWLRTTEFRRALSLGIDRGQFNETFWLGTGVPGSVVPAEHNKYSPGPEFRTRWSTHDPAQANALLDALGLDRRDPEGYRMRKDGTDRLRIDYTVAAATTPDWGRMGEMLREHWKVIGIDLNVKAIEGTLLTLKAVANELQISGSSNAGSEDLYVTPDLVFPFITNNYQGMLGIPYAKWFHSGGTDGKEPPAKVREVMELWRMGIGSPEAKRLEIGKQIWRINAEEVFQVGIISTGPAVYGVRIAKSNLKNVPARLINSTTVKSPGNSLPQTFYFG